MPSKVLQTQPSSCSGCASLQMALDRRDSQIASIQSAMHGTNRRFAELLRRIDDQDRRIAELEGERVNAIADAEAAGNEEEPVVPSDSLPSSSTLARGARTEAAAKTKRPRRRPRRYPSTESEPPKNLPGRSRKDAPQKRPHRGRARKNPFSDSSPAKRPRGRPRKDASVDANGPPPRKKRRPRKDLADGTDGEPQLPRKRGRPASRKSEEKEASLARSAAPPTIIIGSDSHVSSIFLDGNDKPLGLVIERHLLSEKAYGSGFGDCAVVKEVVPNSPAHRAGIQPDDVVAYPGSEGTRPIPYDVFLSMCQADSPRPPVVFDAVRFVAQHGGAAPLMALATTESSTSEALSAASLSSPPTKQVPTDAANASSLSGESSPSGPSTCADGAKAPDRIHAGTSCVQRDLPSDSRSAPPTAPAAPSPATSPGRVRNHSIVPWFDRLEQLRKFHAQNGHFLVGRSALGRWVDRLRLEYFKEPQSSSKLTTEQRAALDSIGFRSILEQRAAAAAKVAQKCSPLKEEEWPLRIQQARAYKFQHGHLLPTPNTARKPFYQWVLAVRNEYRKRKEGQRSKLTVAQMSELNDLGFVWNPATQRAQRTSQRWDAMLKEFIRFRDEMGPDLWNAKLSSRAVAGALPGWVHAQRTAYKRRQKGLQSAMTDERVEKLEEAGFKWERSYVHAVEASSEAERDNASGESKEVEGASKNPQARRHKLIWDQRFQSLEKFKEAKGHINIPNDNRHKVLKGWLNSQHSAYRRWKEGKNTWFTEERKAALEALGVDFTHDRRKAKEENFEKTWRANFDRLKKLKTDHGSLENVPRNDPLYSWMNTQRPRYRKYLGEVNSSCSALTEEQKTALDSLGFDWRTKTQRAWDENLNLLREFKQANGHACIPQEGHPLSKWATKQRQERSNVLAGLCTTSTELEERFKRLDELGFNF